MWEDEEFSTRCLQRRITPTQRFQLRLSEKQLERKFSISTTPTSVWISIRFEPKHSKTVGALIYILLEYYTTGFVRHIRVYYRRVCAQQLHRKRTALIKVTTLFLPHTHTYNNTHALKNVRSSNSVLCKIL